MWKIYQIHQSSHRQSLRAFYGHTQRCKTASPRQSAAPVLLTPISPHQRAAQQSPPSSSSMASPFSSSSRASSSTSHGAVNPHHSMEEEFTQKKNRFFPRHLRQL